jgi:hypothetical protein
MSVSPDSVPVRGLELAVPRSVKYAGVLLAVQALLWGLVAVAGVVALVVNARGIISGPGAPPHGAGAFALWTAPGILEALIPGRMQSHACTAEVPR